MREAAADLNFEEAARLRDEVKRLRATELAVVDDPTIKQRGGAAAKAGALCRHEEIRRRPRTCRQVMKKRRRNARRASPSPRRRAARRRAQGGRGEWASERSSRLQSPQTPPRRNARPGILPYRPGRRHATASPLATAAAAKSSSPPTRASPARSSAPRRAPVAARRGIAAGGRRGRDAPRGPRIHAPPPPAPSSASRSVGESPRGHRLGAPARSLFGERQRRIDDQRFDRAVSNSRPEILGPSQGVTSASIRVAVTTGDGGVAGLTG